MSRLIINDTEIADSMISKGTWVCAEDKKILRSYYDADNVYHEKTSSHIRHMISFSIRERTIDEHESLMTLFGNCEQVPIVFYDDKTGQMKNGIFKISGIQYAHRTVRDGLPVYDVMPVKLEEY